MKGAIGKQTKAEEPHAALKRQRMRDSALARLDQARRTGK
jgi:hypothetical protein